MFGINGSVGSTTGLVNTVVMNDLPEGDIHLIGLTDRRLNNSGQEICLAHFDASLLPAACVLADELVVASLANTILMSNLPP